MSLTMYETKPSQAKRMSRLGANWRRIGRKLQRFASCIHDSDRFGSKVAPNLLKFTAREWREEGGEIPSPLTTQGRPRVARTSKT